jgi:pseudouridine synthase
MARAGVASRRACEEMIAAGKVTVNGRKVTEPGARVQPGRDVIRVDGKKLRAPEKHEYILLYKPRGYLSTVKDPRGRKTVLDLLEGLEARVYPVGRLDYDSEGLLLLTNDGDLTYALTHPKHQIKKTYLARVKGIPSPDKVEQLARGVTLEDGPTAPASVEIDDIYNGNARLRITIHEGRNREVRRMCEHIGHPVIALKRISVGPLTAYGLKTGQYRRLSASELKQIKKLAGLGRK